MVLGETVLNNEPERFYQWQWLIQYYPGLTIIIFPRSHYLLLFPLLKNQFSFENKISRPQCNPKECNEAAARHTKKKKKKKRNSNIRKKKVAYICRYIYIYLYKCGVIHRIYMNVMIWRGYFGICLEIFFSFNVLVTPYRNDR